MSRHRRTFGLWYHLRRPLWAARDFWYRVRHIEESEPILRPLSGYDLTVLQKYAPAPTTATRVYCPICQDHHCGHPNEAHAMHHQVPADPATVVTISPAGWTFADLRCSTCPYAVTATGPLELAALITQHRADCPNYAGAGAPSGNVRFYYPAR